MVQQKLVSSEKTNEKEKICRDEPELRFPEFKDKWKKEKIGEISKTYSGGTPSTSNKNFYIGNIPFIKSGEINSEETEQYINEDAINNSSAKLVKKGDLLLALYGATSGEVAISKLDGAINQAVLKIDNEMDNVFQYNYFLKEKENIVHKYLQGGQGNLSSKIIKNLELYYPNINEQKKIANFLLTIDKKIELLEKKLVLYQQLEAEWRKILFKDIELNSKFFTVDEIFKVISSKRFQIKNSEIKDKGKIPVLTQGKDKAGYFDNAAKLCNIFPIILFGDHTTHLQYINYPFIVAGDGIKLLQSRKENTNMKYLYYALKNYNISPEGYKRHYSILKEVELPIPSDFNQENIVLILNSLENKINLLKDFNKEFKLLKKGLLQKMFI